MESLQEISDLELLNEIDGIDDFDNIPSSLFVTELELTDESRPQAVDKLNLADILENDINDGISLGDESTLTDDQSIKNNDFIKPPLEAQASEADISLDNTTQSDFDPYSQAHKALKKLAKSKLPPLPAGLKTSKSDCDKYFGMQARINFFDQCQSIRRKKIMYSTHLHDPSPPDLAYAIDMMKIGSKRKDSNVEMNPFNPERPVSPLKVNTRVIIRTQTLEKTDCYSQMKLIQKPKDLYLDETSNSYVSEDDDDDSIETKEDNSNNLVEDLNSKNKNDSLQKLKVKEEQQTLPPLLPVRSRGSISTTPLKLKQGKSDSKFRVESNSESDSISSERKNSASKTDEKKITNRRGGLSIKPEPIEVLSPMNSSNSLGLKQTKKVNKSRTIPRNRRLSALNKATNISRTPNATTLKTPIGKPKDAEESVLFKNKADEIDLNQLASSYKDYLQKNESNKLKIIEKELSLFDAKIEPMRLICVDYRDAFNKKVVDKLKKNNSLFQYVEAKRLKHDFYDNQFSDEEDSDPEGEINAWMEESPLSPNFKAPLPKIEKKKTGLKNEPKTETLTLSPRSKFIDSCIRQKLNPRASLILRKSFTRELNLKHFGMGDKIAILFAEAIVGVPHIQSLNVCDNNLTDLGLSAIVSSIQNMSDLIELDMSCNVIGPEAANSLANYLSSNSCPLIRLVLEKADVDDDECRDFVSALAHNRRLQELNLSDNKIGSSENLNTVMPDIVTGGEALADLLEYPDCPLQVLKLGWNMIRLDGAVSLCKSLAANTSLTFLELSFNSLSSLGGIALGDALQENKTLKKLYVSNNSLDSIACLTLCAGILENTALESIHFDGNPIGEQGAKVLMLLPTIIGSRVTVSARNCNISIRDSKNWFDTSALIRKFDLDLSDPFNRAVAIILTYVIPSHQTYIVANSEYLDPDRNEWINLELKDTIDKEYYKHKILDEEQTRVIDGLKRVLETTKDVSKAVALFREMDEDGSGELDEEEFGKLMEAIGMDVDENKVHDIMAEYDVDGGGVIEIAEFLMFLKNQQREANKRLRELTEFPVLIAPNEQLPNSVKRYLPPRQGTLRLSIIDGFTQKETYRVISPGDRLNLLKVAEQSGELLQMTSFGVKNYKIRLNEALGIVESLLKEDSNKVAVLATVLPQMASPGEARALVSKVLGTNLLEISRLKREIGQFYRVIMGQPDGFYSLELNNEMDRMCINRLLEISMTTAHFRSAKRNYLGYGRLGDTSQKGNYSCFRNEFFNHKPVTLTTEFASPLPKSGKVEFDFVSQRRFNKESFVLSDIRFTNLLIKTFQLHRDERVKALKFLSKSKLATDKTLSGDGNTIFEPSKHRAAEIGLFIKKFYDNLNSRSEQLDRYKAKENVKAQWEYDPNKIFLHSANSHKIYKPPLIFGKKDSNEPEAEAEKVTARVSTSRSSALQSIPNTRRSNAYISMKSSFIADHIDEDFSDDQESDDEETASDSDEEKVFPPLPSTLIQAAPTISTENAIKLEDEAKLPDIVEVVIDVNELHHTRAGTPRDDSVISLLDNSETTEQSNKPLKNKRPKIKLTEVWNKYICLMGSKNIPLQAKSAKTLELLIENFETQYFLCRHLELIVRIFEELGCLQMSDDFGSYRVELIVSLFTSVVDLHNFEIVLRRLSSYETACLYCRLGMLNLYNPMKPEGAYELDLSRREERNIVKILAQLAVSEPGDNLPSLQFRWEREMDPMPGYELTEPWLSEEGLPNKGIWNATYYSGEGKGKTGCKPVVKLRKAMLNLVLIEEEEVITENERDSETKVNCVGPPFITSNPGMFVGYLSYNEEDYKAYKDKKGIKEDPKTKKK